MGYQRILMKPFKIHSVDMHFEKTAKACNGFVATGVAG